MSDSHPESVPRTTDAHPASEKPGPEPRREPRIAHPPDLRAASDNVVAAFLDALAEFPAYRLAVATTPARLERDLRVIGQQWDLPVRVKTAPFVEVLAHEDAVPITGDGGLEWRLVRAPTPTNPRRLVIACTAQSDHRQQFAVSPGTLRELDFEVISGVTISHPLNHRLKQFTATAKSLVEVTEELASLADADYSLPSTEAGPIQLNLRLTDRTVLECLRVVAHTAGWQLLVDGDSNWKATDSTLPFWSICRNFVRELRADGVALDRLSRADVTHRISELMEAMTVQTAKRFRSRNHLLSLVPFRAERS